MVPVDILLHYKPQPLVTQLAAICIGVGIAVHKLSLLRKAFCVFSLLVASSLIIFALLLATSPLLLAPGSSAITSRVNCMGWNFGLWSACSRLISIVTTCWVTGSLEVSIRAA